jgi:hypothetical protein
MAQTEPDSHELAAHNTRGAIASVSSHQIDEQTTRRLKEPDVLMDLEIPESSPECYLTGWRLHCTTLGIVLSLLIVNLEVTIVGTSLIAITDDLRGFGETSWVVSGFLVTYMGKAHL